jgi:hypothetical protein
VQHPTTCFLCWTVLVGNNSFPKCRYMQDVLCNVTECIMQFNSWFCGPNKGAFHAYAYITYIHSKILHYLHTETYMHPQCSQSGYVPGFRWCKLNWKKCSWTKFSVCCSYSVEWKLVRHFRPSYVYANRWTLMKPTAGFWNFI